MGPGVTGTELAFHLIEGGAARVRVSSRTPRTSTSASGSPAFRSRSPGRPLEPHSAARGRRDDLVDRAPDLRRPGSLRTAAPAGRTATQLATKGQAPACDDGFLTAVKAGRITVVPAVEGFDGADILLADGSRIAGRRGHRGDRLQPRARPAGGPSGGARRARHPLAHGRTTPERSGPLLHRVPRRPLRPAAPDEVPRALDRQGVHQRPLISPPCQFSTSQREIETIGGSSRSSDAVISVISARVNQRASAISAWSTVISSVRAVP